MKTLHVLVGLVSLAVLVAGCPKKQDDTKGERKQVVQQPDEQPAGALPADKEYGSGTIQAAALQVQTRLDVSMGEGKPDEDLKKAQEGSVTSQQIVVSENRGKLVFATPDFYVPMGTELRYNVAEKKYVLADPGKKEYWVMTGSEIGNLLEGGPVMSRSGYEIEIAETKDKETIAGMEAIKSDATIAFDWSVKTKSGEKKGKVKVKLAIWHTADEKLKESWGDMMVDFLTVPFQDEGGQKVVSELKSKVKFPLKWAMEVQNDTQKKEDSAPRLITTAQNVEVKEVQRPELASPPAGFAAASGPYEFGQGGQTAPEDLLGKLPAKKGTPPKDVKPPEEKKGEK